MVMRTVYCTNIDKMVTQLVVKKFFEELCGEVSQLRLLGDNVHSTRIAFVEFVHVRTKSLFALFSSYFKSLIFLSTDLPTLKLLASDVC
uniref:RRM domain-containing protein n=1 Tax=Arundo donax TaxID=35708 RepID=A0A0A9DJD7_ARUDO